jgi:hypothetical protein
MLLFSFALAAGAFGFRLLKPRPSSSALEGLGGNATAEIWGEVGRIEGRIGKLVDLQKETIDDYQRMSAVEARLIGELDGLKTEIQAQDDKTSSHLQTVESKVSELGQANNANHDCTRRQIASLYDALGAVYHRELLQEYAVYIEGGAKELSAPTKEGACYDQEAWERWEAKERGWRSILKAWCDLAACYSRGIDMKVLTVSEDQYRQTGVAQTAQFPADGIIAYKAFCARWKNWQNWRVEGERAVHQVAFNGGTAGSRPIYPGAGEMEELGARDEAVVRSAFEN